MFNLNPKIIVAVIFCCVYLYLVFFKHNRGLAVWSGIVLISIFALLSKDSFFHFKELFRFINWNVIGIFTGTLILAEIFIQSKVPVLLADIFVDRSKNVGKAILWVCALSSFISAFVENVATVLIVAPVALALSRKLKVSPVPFLIGLAISSNLQGTATLIGDPPSMILAGSLRMNFNDFFVYQGKPGIFFAIQLGAAASFIVLYLFFRKYKEPVLQIPREMVTSWIPTLFLAGLIVALAISPIWDPDFRFLGGIICIGFAIAGLIWQWLRNRVETVRIIKGYDWDTTFFLAGVFVMVGFLETVGIIENLKDFIVSTLGSDPFINYTFIVWFSVLVSGFIDNVPYITAMIPITIRISSEIGIPPYFLTFGLLIGSCLGGNITPIGASANIVSVGILKREGYTVSFWQFARIGLPFTLAATLLSYLFILLIWG